MQDLLSAAIYTRYNMAQTCSTANTHNTASCSLESITFTIRKPPIPYCTNTPTLRPSKHNHVDNYLGMVQQWATFKAYECDLIYHQPQRICHPHL